MSIMHHYEMMGDHFNVKGYEDYDAAAKMMQDLGQDAVVDAYVEGQVWGTPQQMLEQFEKRRDALGDFDVLLVTRFGGMPFEVAERTVQTFAKEVIPELKSWNVAATRAA